MNYRLLNFSLLLAGLSLAVTSCKDDPPEDPPPPSTSEVIIANRGPEVGGSGSLSSYDPKQKTAQHNLYYKENVHVVGNTLYSIYVDGNRTFLMMAGTGEILVVDTRTYELKQRITGFGAPHRIVKVAENKFYVSDLQEEGIWVLNMNNGNLVKSILTGHGPENMLVWEDFVFVANSGSTYSGFPDSTITVIHALEDTIMAQIQVAHNPHSMQVDKNDILWVLCSGIEDQSNPFNSTPGALLSFDLNKDSLEYYTQDSLLIRDTLIFTDNQPKPIDLMINKSGDALFFLDYYKEADLMQFDIAMNNLPNSPFIPGSFSAAGYDPIEGEIYLSDWKDGIGPGEVYRFDEGGGQLDLIEVGIRPMGFGFK